jgi:pimeloyl-ACP methyl ester carboxylesterase/DNA-binding CsgD family transcriptional regulator
MTKTGGPDAERQDDHDHDSPARRLLRMLLDAKSQPENFDATCSAWVEMSEAAQQDPGFNELAEKVFSGVSAEGGDVPIDAPRRACVREIASFTVDRRGVIVTIDERARELLGAGAGELLSDLLNEAPPILGEDLVTSPSPLVELVGSDGIRRLGRLAFDPSIGRTRVSILGADISPVVEGYLRWTIGLTSSEVEIVRLILQRASTTEIAERRYTTVNTARTHINSIIRKLKCRSITEVVAAVYELSLLPEDNSWGVNGDSFGGKPMRGALVSLPGGRAQIEYVRYGDPAQHPLVLLHSIEYGAHPPPDFVSWAVELGYCIYVPYRPGYARSTPAATSADAADMIIAFFERLNLQDITLVMVSSGAPVGLHMMRKTPRIARAVCVNFLLTNESKIEFAKPQWIRGLLQLAARSGSSFSYVLKMTTKMMRLAGAQRFYEAVYAGHPADLAFVGAHPKEVGADAELLMSVDPASVQCDLIDSFVAIPDIEAALSFGPAIKVVFGENSHGVRKEQLDRSEREVGIEHHILKGTGRNSIFQKPQEFFEIVRTIPSREDEIRRSA